jgi:hypothetical protein
LYAAKGNSALAAQYIDSTIIVKDSLDRRFSALQPLRAQQKIERQQQKTMQDKLAYEKKLKVIERNALLTIVLLLIALLVYVYYATRRRLREEQALKDLQLHDKERKLQLAADQLHEFTQNIQEKNRLIENLEQQFHVAENDAILEQLRQSTILTDADWEKFRALFEHVHSGFLNRLRNRFPHLTPAETRFLVLSKLGFNTKEMAACTRRFASIYPHHLVPHPQKTPVARRKRAGRIDGFYLMRCIGWAFSPLFTSTLTKTIAGLY